MPSSMLTYRYRIKDSTSRKHLQRLAWSVNRVWNYCNEVSMLALRRDKRWLSAFDLINLTAGVSKDLGLHSDTIAEVCREYVTRRRQFKAWRLKWRSKKRSLGWVPFKTRFLTIDGDSIKYLSHRFRFWLSRAMNGVAKTGSFSQDARGRWYINVQCEVDDPGTPLRQAEIGIDLGLKNTVTCSDGTVYTRTNITRRYANALARAQQAHKKKRVAALHAKIANSRHDFAHKTTTAIVNRASLVVVGNVSSSRLAGTRLAKSIYDAGWHQLRTMLAYKAMRLGVVYTEVNESGSSVTCADCLQRTGPRGLSQLGVREWVCTGCGSVHDRDHNASRLILRWGRPTPSGNPLT